MNPSELQNIERELIALKGSVLSRLYHLNEDKKGISNPIPKSFDDQAVLSENDEVIDELDVQDSIELESINDALKRIKTGAFGICISCGNEISPKRLKAMPYARNCIECQNGDE